MSIEIKQIIDNIEDIFLTDSALTAILDFERVLDEIDLYSFRNWKKGELVEGPVYEKYFISCKFMWPYKLMPDPRGAERLLDHGCEVNYELTKLIKPIEVEEPDDFRPGTKFAKNKSYPIWVVEIVMPKQLMSDINIGSLELEGTKIDLDEVDEAYDEGDDKAPEQQDDATLQSPK
jgi:hypothetical protein